MLLTRRTILSRLLLATTAGVWWWSPLGIRLASRDSRNPEHEIWLERLGQRFRVEMGPDQSAPGTTLVLKEASLLQYRDDRHRPLHLRPAAISLLFSGPVATSLTSDTHTLTHPELGDLRLFLHNTVRDDYPYSATFEAVLN